MIDSEMQLQDKYEIKNSCTLGHVSREMLHPSSLKIRLRK